MKVGLLTQWFDPEPGPASLPGELARELVRRGHDVQVLTGFPNYPTGKVYPGYTQTRRLDEIVEGVKIRRVPLFPSHDSSAVKRIGNYASFGISAAVNGADCLMDRDVVWVSNSPPTVALTMHRLGRRSIPMVLHVLDLWPDNVVTAQLGASGRISSALVTGIHWWNHRMYGAADRVLTISPGVIDVLDERGVDRPKLAYAPLWSNESILRPTDGSAKRREMGVGDDTVVLMYAGAIGETQGLDVLVRALAEQPTDVASNLECWILGGGVWETELRQLVRQLPTAAPRVRFFGRVPMEEIAAWSAASDISYVGLKQDAHAAYTMPSKVQASLALSKAIITPVPGDVAALVRSREVGFVANSVGVDGLSEAIGKAVRLGRRSLGRIGHRAREVYDEEFSLRAGSDRIEGILEEVSRVSDPVSATDLSLRTIDRDDYSGSVFIVEATPADVSQIVDVHIASFPGFFLSLLGPRFLRIFYEELCNEPDAILLAAIRDGRLVGFVGGVVDESEFFRSLKRRKKWDFILAGSKAATLRPSVLPRLWRARRRDTENGVPDIPATLLSIGVDPKRQGIGVGAALLREFCDRLESLGATQYTLTTDAIANEATIRFYERQGLVAVREHTTPEGRAMLEFAWRG